MKTKACICCNGSGRQLDNTEIGIEMRRLRTSRGLTLREVARLMKPAKTASYLCDLENGRRNWKTELVEKFRKACI